MADIKNKTDRDQQLIDLLVRYRLLTNKAIQRTVMQNQSMNAVTKVTARLCKSEIFSRYSLMPPQHYFTAGKKLANQNGWSIRKTEPLGPQALPTELAVLIYSTEIAANVRRLLPSEIKNYMPWLPEGMQKAIYCIGGDGVLQLVIIDLGGSPRHVSQKTQKVIDRKLEVSQLQEMAKTERLRLTVLTTSNEKAQAIFKHRKSSGMTTRIRMKLVVVPVLSQILLSQS